MRLGTPLLRTPNVLQLRHWLQVAGIDTGRNRSASLCLPQFYQNPSNYAIFRRRCDGQMPRVQE